jgi:hypothetical protein
MLRRPERMQLLKMEGNSEWDVTSDEEIYDESGCGSGCGIARRSKIKEREYKQNIRGIDEIHKNGHGFYRKILGWMGGFSESVKQAYEGLEHKPENLRDKRPNITRLGNLRFGNGGFIYGSTMGHKHTKEMQTQEVYEFNGYGGMLLGFDDKVQLYVCKAGDKVIVPGNCIMTIFNFSARDLITLDMANPDKNESSKDILKEKDGPMMAVYHPGIIRDRSKKESHSGDVKMDINAGYGVFGLSYDARLDFWTRSGEGSLAKEILDRKKDLKRYNIEVLQGSRIVEAVGRDGNRYVLDKSLVQLVDGQDKRVHRVLGMI